MDTEYIETNKQKICSCGGTAFTITKRVPPALEWKYEDPWGEVHDRIIRYQGTPKWCCIVCGEIHTHKTLNYVDVEQFSYVPQDLQFITLDLRHQIDTLIRLIEHGMDPTEEIKKLKGTLPLPFENYSPLWE